MFTSICQEISVEENMRGVHEGECNQGNRKEGAFTAEDDT